MPSFNLLNWTIDMEHHTRHEFNNDIYVQSKFVHEYVHYVQTLASTIGRIIFAELIRISIRAGVYKSFGNNTPDPPQQINLWDALEQSTPTDFNNTDVKTDFSDFNFDLRTALHLIHYQMNIQGNSGIIKRDFSIFGRHIPDFSYIRKDFNNTTYWIPITDAVLYENMARQIQKQFLAFNNPSNSLSLDTSGIDDLRHTHGEIFYTCLYDYLIEILPEGEDIVKWTITLCQFSLMCSFPGSVFHYITDLIISTQVFDIDEIINVIRKDKFIASQYNNPNIQNTLDEMINKFGTFIKPTENYEIYELAGNIVNIINTVNNNWGHFYDPLINWNKVEVWIKHFGCPPIRFADGEMLQIAGIATNDYWHKYLIKTIELLR